MLVQVFCRAAQVAQGTQFPCDRHFRGSYSRLDCLILWTACLLATDMHFAIFEDLPCPEFMDVCTPGVHLSFYSPKMNITLVLQDRVVMQTEANEVHNGEIWKICLRSTHLI